MAQLDVQFGVFTLTTPSSTGEVDHAHGLPFTPKAMICFAIRGTSFGASGRGNVHFNVGQWANAGTTSGTGWGMYSLDNQDTSVVYQNKNNGRFILAGGDATVELAASVLSADGTNVRLSWVNTTGNLLISVMAFGGADLEAYHLASQWIADTDPHDTPTNEPPFRPDVVFVQTIFPGIFLGGQPSFTYSMGVATDGSGSLVQHVVGARSVDNLGTSDCERGHLTNAIFGTVGETVANKFGRGAITSFNTEGFTYQNSIAPTAVKGYSLLCLKGIDARLVTDTQKTSTGTKATTVSGITPEFLVMFGARLTATGVEQADASFSIGCSDGTNERAVGWADDDNLDFTQSYMNQDNDCCARAVDPDSIVGEANVSSFSADTVTLNWTIANGTAYLWSFLAMAAKQRQTIMNYGLRFGGN